ncbi:hypothetical protein EVAR_62014_1 [Eumeta japonica]|uniref:Uncharacterized protein n=1 Tax=Eumeta variegata TaxID=151549 RepID=A0A4C1ZZV6_EUMVA|nr:hypothetical protein EVAR_62014_1 [Eumeta japonica]
MFRKKEQNLTKLTTVTAYEISRSFHDNVCIVCASISKSVSTTQQSIKSSRSGKLERKAESEDNDQINNILKSKHITPAQSNTEKRINCLDSQSNAELTARDNGLGGIGTLHTPRPLAAANRDETYGLPAAVPPLLNL